MTPPNTRPRAMQPMHIGALFLLLLSALGILISGHLTRLKFRSVFTPWNSDFSSCQLSEEFSCRVALESDWSTIFGVPLTIFATGLYLVIFVLALGIFLERLRLRSIARPLLLLLGIVDLLVSIWMGYLAFVVLETSCPLCISLYVMSLLTLLGALVVNLPLDRSLRACWRELVSRSTQTIRTLFVCAMVFVCAVGLQSTAYHGARWYIDTSDMMQPAPEFVPPAHTIDLRPTDDPKLTVFAVVDPTCPYCRAEFPRLSKLAEQQQHTISFVLFPRERGSTCVPEYFEYHHSAAQRGQACQASLAVACTEHLHPGRGVELLGELFASHREGEPLDYSQAALARAIRRIGLQGDHEDPDDPLFQCINNKNSKGAEVVRAHVQSVIDHAPPEQFSVPILYFVGHRDGALRLDRITQTGNLPYNQLVFAADATVASTSEP